MLLHLSYLKVSGYFQVGGEYPVNKTNTFVSMNYKVFGTKTGLVVSELVLGTATLGTASGYGATPEDVQLILKGYADAGGNFIDTSNFYQLGQAEQAIGEFLTENRSSFVIATKYSRGSHFGVMGNHRKAMVQSIEQSLQRLKTDYIDIYMPHFDDRITPIEEIMRGIEDLVKAGKVIYGGLSNFPAWRVAAAASISPLAAIQVEYNLLQRHTESELLPAADAFGLGVLGYSPMAGGLLTGKYSRGEEGRATHLPAGVPHAGKESKVLEVLTAIGEELSVKPGQVAVAWVMAKGVFPIIGARTRGQLDDNIIAADIKLSAEQRARLDEVSAIPLTYPNDINTVALMTGNGKYKVVFP
jgi:aryl-alcohol dehydrogenase-like predicted oxidoreductase